MIKIIISFFFITLLNVDINSPKINEEFTDLEADNSEKRLNSNKKPINNINNRIFFVSHNKSPNIVVYQANKKDDGYLDLKKPVDVFWVLNTKGKKIEELNLLEKKLAFGFKLITIVEGQKYKLKLNAIKSKIITIIREKGGKVKSYIKIKGKPALLRNVFFNYEESFYLPQVQYLDFKGIDVKSGKFVTERLNVNK